MTFKQILESEAKKIEIKIKDPIDDKKNVSYLKKEGFRLEHSAWWPKLSIAFRKGEAWLNIYKILPPTSGRRNYIIFLYDSEAGQSGADSFGTTIIFDTKISMRKNAEAAVTKFGMRMIGGERMLN